MDEWIEWILIFQSNLFLSIAEGGGETNKVLPDKQTYFGLSTQLFYRLVRGSWKISCHR